MKMAHPTHIVKRPHPSGATIVSLCRGIVTELQPGHYYRPNGERVDCPSRTLPLADVLQEAAERLLHDTNGRFVAVELLTPILSQLPALAPSALRLQISQAASYAYNSGQYGHGCPWRSEHRDAARAHIINALELLEGDSANV